MSVNSIRNLIEIASQKTAGKIAMKQGNITLKYNELFEKVNQIANYFNTLNLPCGSRIGIYSDKSIEQVIAILALLSTNLVIVPITRTLKPEQVEYIINDCDIKCIITDVKKIETIQKANFKDRVITYKSYSKDGISFDELYKYQSKKYQSFVKGHNNAIITYSFVSSGFPKGIVITHRGLIDGARVVSNYLRLKEDDIISGVLSFNVDYGFNQIFCSLYMRSTLALHKFLLPNDFFTHVIDDKVTVLPIMPVNIAEMFDEDEHRLPTPKQLENIRIITSSGGNITSKMRSDIDKYFPTALFYSMHGLSEAFRSAYLDPSQIKIRPDSIGKAIPDVDLYVINEKGESCKVREVGELIHRGACIYKGYWNSPKDTKLRFKSIDILNKVINLQGELSDEIVVASGDYVYRDEEGYIYFVGRHDDMIKTSGYRVNPIEIESAVSKNIKNITKAVVFSVADEKIEEKIVLVYQAPLKLSQNEIIFELKKHLASYMIPSVIIHKKSIPLHFGEIDKDALKKEVIQNV